MIASNTVLRELMVSNELCIDIVYPNITQIAIILYDESMKIPVTVFTGYLGSGKTTIILNLIQQLDPSYKVVWLKNEYGNISVDSELAKENNIQVKEMLNGCLCCVLVGKLKDALNEILAEYKPDRIIIESSGTAYPLPIVFEISQIGQLELDGVINVIDAENFNGYHDKGYVAKMQAGYTDLIIINKIDRIDPNQLDKVLDEVYDLNPSTPKVQTANGNLSRNLLLGLDSKLVEDIDEEDVEHDHHDSHDHPDDVEVVDYIENTAFNRSELEQLLSTLKLRGFIRIKGSVRGDDDKYYLLNWVFGRNTWQELSKYSGPTKIAFMGKDIKNFSTKLLSDLRNLAKTV